MPLRVCRCRGRRGAGVRPLAEVTHREGVSGATLRAKEDANEAGLGACPGVADPLLAVLAHGQHQVVS